MSKASLLIVQIHCDFTINAVHAFQNTKRKLFWFHTHILQSLFLLHARPNILLVNYDTELMTTSIVCAWTRDMTGQVGGFQNPGICLQAFPSFLPRPLPALLIVPFFARSLTLISDSLMLLNCTEMLATPADTLEFTHIAVNSKLWVRQEKTFVFMFSGSK